MIVVPGCGSIVDSASPGGDAEGGVLEVVRDLFVGQRRRAVEQVFVERLLVVVVRRDRLRRFVVEHLGQVVEPVLPRRQHVAETARVIGPVGLDRVGGRPGGDAAAPSTRQKTATGRRAANVQRPKQPPPKVPWQPPEPPGEYMPAGGPEQTFSPVGLLARTLGAWGGSADPFSHNRWEVRSGVRRAASRFGSQGAPPSLGERNSQPQRARAQGAAAIDKEDGPRQPPSDASAS